MSEPKKASDILEELGFDFNNIPLGIPVVDPLSPEYIEQERKFQQEKEREIFLADLQLAKIPLKHFNLLKEMTVKTMPDLYSRIRKEMKEESILICGPNKPKTLSACAWLAHRYKKGDSIFYIKAFDLLKEATDFSSRNKSPILRRAFKAKALVIDNLQNVNLHDINISNLSHLLSERNDNGQRTIAISTTFPKTSILIKSIAESMDRLITA